MSPPLERNLEKSLVDFLPPVSGPMLVHSDISLAKIVVPEKASRVEALRRHSDLLFRVSSGRPIWMPTFNYDFCKGVPFKVETDCSQVGVLSEYFRYYLSNWRTPVPVFNFAGTGLSPLADSIPEKVYPFGPGNLFDELTKQDGVILFYGTSVRSATFLHWVENSSGVDTYRYEKTFVGEVENHLGSKLSSLTYRVRPLDCDFDYDWPRIQSDLREIGILRQVQQAGFRAQAVGARELFDFWTMKVSQNSLYFLDARTRDWVQAKLHDLGRGFVLEDFEPVPP